MLSFIRDRNSWYKLAGVELPNALLCSVKYRHPMSLMNACSPDSDAELSLKSPGISCCPAIKSLYVSQHLKKAVFPNPLKKQTKSHPDSA